MNIFLDKIKEIIKMQQIRFLIVGVLNTIVGYGIYALLVMFDFNYLLANTIGTIIGIIHSYIWNRYFTFNSRNSVKKEIIKFVFVYFVSYLIGLINLYFFVNNGINKYLAGILNIFITTLISWFGHKNFSFRR